MPRSPAINQDEVRAFVIETVDTGLPNLAKRIQLRFGVSRPTAHNYISALIRDGIIVRERQGHYKLATEEHPFDHAVKGLEEHRVWAAEIAPNIGELPSNIFDIFQYGFTEMVNNVVDHSESEGLRIMVLRSPAVTEVQVHDFGVGIFRKIATALGLEDDRHAVLELSKGKVTTDPENHTGEGIFFSSRAFDRFRILSGDVFFTHEHDKDEDWILGEERQRETADGTSVFMTMRNNSDTDLKDVFDEYSTDTDDYRFNRTVVPVKLMQYGDDRLVSRSQAKRLMNRFDRFQTVVLNFEGVPSVGQAFADEVFRVFPSQHPDVEVIAINTNEQVSRMMNRATNGTSR